MFAWFARLRAYQALVDDEAARLVARGRGRLLYRPQDCPDGPRSGGPSGRQALVPGGAKGG